MHPLARRQLQRFFRAELPSDPKLTAFFEAVSDAYTAADDDRKLLERTLALASQETEERYHALQRDIAQRERAESERDAFFRVSPDLLAILDAEHLIVQANPSWERVLGHSGVGLVKTSVYDLLHGDDAERVRREFMSLGAANNIRDFECRARHSSGAWRVVSATLTTDLSRGLFFLVMRDITEQRDMARELAQAQKLEAVGQLASGVAHEINTPVQFVGDNVSFATTSFTDLFDYIERVEGALTDAQRKALEPERKKADLEYLQEEVPRSLSEAQDGLRRVAELVRALKEFAHPDAGDKVAADMNKIIERAVVLARSELKHVARVEMALGQVRPIACHSNSLGQVVLNLLVNAAHAIEERSKADRTTRDQHLIRVSTTEENGELVVSVSDTGCGIPAAIKDRIFEPFFTTKPMGKGSGQGLPLVRNVVRAHGGRVDVQSAVGAGTTFSLRLPLVAAGPERSAA